MRQVETSDGTRGRSSGTRAAEQDAALLLSPDVLRLLDEDPARRVELPIETTRQTAADDLAYLAVYRGRHIGVEPESQTPVPHPRFEDAVAAARAAPDEDRGWQAARRLFGTVDAWAALEAMDEAPRSQR